MPQSKFLDSSGYTLTWEPGNDAGFPPLEPELREEAEELYWAAHQGKSSTIKRLKQLIKQYPHHPSLKNHLTSAYLASRKYKKAFAVNDQCLAAHPNYLFAQLTKANEFYLYGEFDRMPEILGEAMDLGKRFPDRKIFHISEFLTFYKVTCLYFIETGQLDAALDRLELMESMEPKSRDVLEIKNILFRATTPQNLMQLMEKRKNLPSTKGKGHNRKIQTSRPPQFQHEQIRALYEQDVHIAPAFLKEILTLPRVSLIKDLEEVIMDGVWRYEYFQAQQEAEGWTDHEYEFMLHALLLLGELRAEESLPIVLEMLRQDVDFLEFWFGDHLTETLWEPIYKMGRNQLSTLKAFILHEELTYFAKAPLLGTLEAIGYNEPSRRTELLETYRELFDFYLNLPRKSNLLDAQIIGELVMGIAVIKPVELLEPIKKLFEANLIDENLGGDYEEVSQYIHKGTTANRTLSIFDRYKIIQSSFSYSESEKSSFFPYSDLPTSEGMLEKLLSDPLVASPQQPIVKGKKVGRNEPCPCGSGKKYKKCCL